MATHHRLDGFSGFVGVVEWDDGYVVVQDVGFDYPVEQGAADESELAVNGGCRSASKTPRFGSVMGDRRIGVLQVRDCDLVAWLVNAWYGRFILIIGNRGN